MRQIQNDALPILVTIYLFNPDSIFLKGFGFQFLAVTDVMGQKKS